MAGARGGSESNGRSERERERERDSDIVVVGREKSERYAKALKDALRGAVTEEDVRLATYTFLKDLSQEAGVQVKIRNEKVVLSGGRVDSLFDNIVFEFKKPRYFETPAGIDEAVQGRKVKGERKGGLVEYLLSLAIDESSGIEDFYRNVSTKIGVGFDGQSLMFVRYVPSDKLEIPSEIVEQATRGKKRPTWLAANIDGSFTRMPQKDIKAGLRYLYLHLRAISPRVPLKPVSVSQRFGEESPHFKKHLGTLHSRLWSALKDREPHVETLYGEWRKVFGEVYGDKRTGTGAIALELSEEYGDAIDFKKYGGIDIPLLVFSIHTYYSIVLKLLVSELLSALLNPFAKSGTLLALTDAKFRERIVESICGDYFRKIGVENFFEPGFFEWWVHAWDHNLSSTLREMIQLLEEMEVTTSIIKPELIGDMVKETYHGLMPQSLRHLLGEYFTPDWLADFTVELSGFGGKAGETFLDPACGSGTFLALAIKKKMSANPEADRKEFVKDVLKTVVGFDLNPISVIASKTNYLLTLGDLSDLDFSIKIPVFQCDSILIPAVHARQKEGGTKPFSINTICGEFEVPRVGTREEAENLLDVIKTAVANDFRSGEFLKKLRLECAGIDEKVSLALFKKVKGLDRQRKDKLWIPILKNAFAPVFSRGQYDFVVGNPPWVSWRSMSKSYRDLTLPIWLSYDIFNKSAYDKITTHDDFAMAFTYVSSDHYLRPHGKLCFVISQTFFKSKKGGEGFRKFEITRDGLRVPLKVETVIDMVNVKPFPEVANATAVMLLQKGEPTKYPVPYAVWRPTSKVRESDSLREVKGKVAETVLGAIPIRGTNSEEARRSPWATITTGKASLLEKLRGKSAYRGRKGVEPLGAKGIYILKEPVLMKGGRVRISNDLQRGRLKEIEEMGQHEEIVEEDFVYPQISGRNIDRWGLNSTSYILLPHLNKHGPHNGVPETELKVNFTKTFEWLSHWKPVLLETRERNGKFYDPKIDPFYVLDNVGTYTFAPFKVVWREQNKQMVACVVSVKDGPPLKGKMVIPDSKVLFCPLENEGEAHYLCAVLNSRPVTEVIESYTLELQRGIDILENIQIPKFNPRDRLHQTLSDLSMKAHRAYSPGKNPSGIQKQIDGLVLGLWEKK